jgi:RimJ/RimL family protein N-acetyltransferase
LVAITSLDNERSIRLLEKIGFAFEKIIQVSANDEGTRLFGINFSVPPAT